MGVCHTPFLGTQVRSAGSSVKRPQHGTQRASVTLPRGAACAHLTGHLSLVTETGVSACIRPAPCCPFREPPLRCPEPAGRFSSYRLATTSHVFGGLWSQACERSVRRSVFCWWHFSGGARFDGSSGGVPGWAPALRSASDAGLQRLNGVCLGRDHRVLRVPVPGGAGGHTARTLSTSSHGSSRRCRWLLPASSGDWGLDFSLGSLRS